MTEAQKKDIVFFPCDSEESRRYVRMLAIECEDEGYAVAIGQGEGALAVIDCESPRLLPDLSCCDLKIGFGTMQTCPIPGIDLYFSRPVDTVMLLSTLGKRPEAPAAPVRHISRPITLNPTSRILTFRGVAISLSEKESGVMTLLLAHRGRTVTKRTLLDTVWAGRKEGGGNVLEACIRGLRRKLDERFGVRLIESVRGEGYCLYVPREEL